ncbi:hypothetical protein DCAR_0832151 [Daucus carota subsp. sativus]|uniref:CBS domain-containing protein n=2 Tax=Daucus carota subsp. sativus TaxID=79200 RepID=A0AAF0XQY9_DAUCS|nr:hypothetical protein DCAR_0832151 [Daucus carota subsp. sativus]
MAGPEGPKDILMDPSYSSYFDMVQSRKKLPMSLQETLTDAFARIPVSSFPQVPRGKVIEIQADQSVGEAIKILSDANILSAPVKVTDEVKTVDWRERYLGILDYSAIVLWVLEGAEFAAAVLATGSATAAGVGAGAAGALGALAVGATGPVAAAGITAAAVGAAVVSGVAAGKGMSKDAASAADKMGEDFYKVLLEEEPFTSTTVRSVVKSYRWAPFIPVSADSSMLCVLLLLSKYRLRNVPVVERGEPCITNYITQSAVIKGLERCKGRDWFDSISAHPITELGLPFMSSDEVISIENTELVLEAFKKMKDNQIGGLPVVGGPEKKIVGSLSIRDIRYLLLNHDLFSNFRQVTVGDFINTVAGGLHTTQKVGVAVTCSLDSTLEEVIHILASKSVHRIYVVAGDGKEIVGVITLRDVISCFIYEPANFFDNYFAADSAEVVVSN